MTKYTPNEKEYKTIDDYKVGDLFLVTSSAGSYRSDSRLKTVVRKTATLVIMEHNDRFTVNRDGNLSEYGYAQYHSTSATPATKDIIENRRLEFEKETMLIKFRQIKWGNLSLKQLNDIYNSLPKEETK